MTMPHGSGGVAAPPSHDATMGTFTPHAANEGNAGEWLSEVLPTDEHEVVHTVHRDDHMPRGWHDLGPYGWFAAAMMVLVLGLIVYGYVLPWLGVTHMWQVDPLR